VPAVGIDLNLFEVGRKFIWGEDDIAYFLEDDLKLLDVGLLGNFCYF
jgi:hypothetical protein